MLTSASSGLLAGIASFFLYKVGVFLCGAALGVTVALVLNMAVLYKLPGGNVPFIVAAVVLGLAFGGLGFRFMRHTMVAATSIVGAYAFIRSVGFFAGNYPSNEFDIANELKDGQTDLPWQIWAYFAGWGALVLLGVGVQLRFTARKPAGGGRDAWEKAYDESDDISDLVRGRRSKKGKRKGGRKGKKGRGKGGKGRKGGAAGEEGLLEGGGINEGSGETADEWGADDSGVWGAEGEGGDGGGEGEGGAAEGYYEDEAPADWGASPSAKGIALPSWKFGGQGVGKASAPVPATIAW